jgi:hypothetical protein
MNRRGFLAGLFAGPIVMAIEPLSAFEVAPVRTYTSLDLSIHHDALIAFRKDVTREYIRQNLFSPFNEGSDEPWCKRLGATEASGSDAA